MIITHSRAQGTPSCRCPLNVAEEGAGEGAACVTLGDMKCLSLSDIWDQEVWANGLFVIIIIIIVVIMIIIITIHTSRCSGCCCAQTVP